MAAEENGRLAVVTGASSGIGFELAKVFVEEGFDLLIVGENGALRLALEELKETGAKIQAHRVDLAAEWGVIELYRHIQNTGRPIDVLALNAGIGVGGAFATETKLSDELKLIDLNLRSTVHLCELVMADMVRRDAGLILITSAATTMPNPFQAVYGASKAFVQSFATALEDELKDTRVTVAALMPEAREAEFFERGEAEDAESAREVFDALMAGKEEVAASG
jgi:short-subunit dehydrogenase